MKFWDLDSLMKWEPEKWESYVGDENTGLLVPGGRMIIYGRWGTFKSMMTMDMVFSILQKRNWLAFPTTKAKIAILQIEIPQYQMQSRLKTYMEGHLIKLLPKDLYVANEPFFKLDRQGLQELEMHLRAQHAEILFIDPVYKVLSGDPNKPQDVGDFLDFIDHLVYGTGVSVVLVGHIRKEQQDQDGTDKLYTKDTDRLHITYEKVRHSHVEILSHDVVVTRKTLAFHTYPCTCPFTRNLENELVGSAYYANWADTMISVQESVHKRGKKADDG